ncbi:TPA: hypothetical protein P9G18_000045 [Pseudomonas aeruginosa]|nr:hypothetical protein [Pseudomonas aeruginosa]
MSEVKRFDHVNHAHVDDCAHIENPGGAWVKASDYDALAAEAQALREEVARSEQHRNDQADLIVSLRTEVAALKHSQQVLIGSRNAHRDERDAARKEVAELRMARDDFKLERDLARQNFCDEQAANYQLQAHLKACLGELSELRARVVVPDGYALMPLEPSPEMRLASHRYKRKNKVSTGPGFWRAMAEAAPRINSLTVGASALDTLRRFATGDIKHLNNGHCPDALEGHETRDPNCSVCRALIDTEESK